VHQQEIVIIPKLPDRHIAWLEKHFICHKYYEAQNKEDFLETIKDSVRGLVTSGFRGYKRDLIESLPNLEIISIWGSGLQAVDLEIAKEKGITVTNTPDHSRIAVAELAIALLLNVGRRIHEADAYVKSGKWEDEGFVKYGLGFFGKTIGIVALGRIGRAVAERAEAFGMKVIYYGPHRKSDVSYQYLDDIRSLARESDFLILCCPETPETTGLITADVLEKLGPEGILINVARGVVVDEDALIDALQKRIIKGAGLDVYVNEPEVPEALRKMENVILVPHIGTATADVRNIRKEMTVENLLKFFNGEPVSGPVYIPPL